MSKKMRKAAQKLQMWFSFPQILLFGILVILTAITLGVSYAIQRDPFWSSVLSNIFAGLVTGLVLFLLSGTRQIHLARLEERINWLKGLEHILLKYMPLHMTFVHKHPKGEERFNDLYDILCDGNIALEYLRWDPDNKKLGFDPLQYCEKEYGIKIAQMTEHSEALHDRLRYETLPDDDRDAWEWFKPFDQDLHQLYNAVRQDIESSEIRLASFRRSII